MIASLPMYDLPEIRGATDEWWRGLTRHMGVEGELVRGPDHMLAWRDPGLVFSQTCGYPLTHEFRGKLRLLATPHYAAPGCVGPLYSSIVLTREKAEPEAMRGAVAAFNSPDSMSGMLALKLVFAPFAERGRFFSRAVRTGKHLKSMEAVRKGEADVCAIDAVTVALVRRHRSEALDGLVEIARSPQVPALPFVTSMSQPEAHVARLRNGLARAFSDPALARARDALLLAGFSILDDADYERIVDLERRMEDAGGLVLA
jgi:ABC-type phosphate/phosphonate transport system substrate-binding protein